jgi:hypothetical protein
MWKLSYHPYNLENKITEDSKVLIGIGDSFCSGHGACSIELWEKFGWDEKRMLNQGWYEVGLSNAKNSWVNQLCVNHMPDWTPLNLGISGKGNRFAIKELMVNKILGFEKAKEKIVVFAVSGFERLDLANDLITENHFSTLWPFYEGDQNGYGILTSDSGEELYSERFAISEFILNVIELMNWCELHNAKLLLISGFTPELNRKHFIDVFSPIVISSIGQMKLDELISSVPWEKIIRPLGFSCITDMLMHLEGWEDKMPRYGFRNVKINTIGPNGFMTKCQHPSEKAHKLLAEIIYEHILNYDKLIPNTKKSTKTKMI